MKNLIFKQNIFLSGILSSKLGQVVGESQESEKSFYLYPTVFSGNLDISKAREKLQFQPTPAEQAFRETLAWYDEAFVKFPAHRDSVLTELFQTAIPKQNR